MPSNTRRHEESLGKTLYPIKKYIIEDLHLKEVVGQYFNIMIVAGYCTSLMRYTSTISNNTKRASVRPISLKNFLLCTYL
jgi:hypothetical protein